MGHILKGEPVKQSIEIAMTAVGKMVDRFKNKEDINIISLPDFYGYNMPYNV